MDCVGPQQQLATSTQLTLQLCIYELKFITLLTHYLNTGTAEKHIAY